MCLTLILSLWNILLLFWLVTMFTNKRVLKRQATGSRLRYSILYILGLWLLFSSHWHSPHSLWGLVVLPHSVALNLISLVLAVLGFFLAIWARLVLGGNWSGAVTFKQDHELIERGPYAWMRHPIYTALLLMSLGTALAIGALGSLIALPILFLSFWIKFRQEEALMIEHFGDRYLAYMKRVCALIPFVF